MRLAHTLMLAGSLFIVSPALAQGNAAAPDNGAAATPVDANAAAPAAPAPPAEPAATPADQNAAVPPTVATPADTGTTVGVKQQQRRGFPWGVLGLLGLIGLFGVRKVKG